MTERDASGTLVRRALGGHAALGLLASALLYVVALTGSLAVVHDQWTRWEDPAVPETAVLSPAAAQAALMRAIGDGHGATLSLTLPTADFPRAVVTTDIGSRYVDAAGRLLSPKRDGWSEFVVALHETLCLPATWGMILVGALGVALLALTFTGVLAHPRIVRDAFRLRTRHHPQVARVDWHNRLGVWTLPFAVAVAFTGAFLGLSSIGTAMMARLETGGDVQRVYAPVFGGAAIADPRPAPLADAAGALRALAHRVPSAAPTLLVVRGPGTRGQDVQIYATHLRRLIFGEAYLFDAAGRWKGATGLADGAMGQQVAASTYDLHFGNFGGPAVEVAYILLGLGLCGITATGTSIWLHRRRTRGHGSDRLEACWSWVVWGTPLVLTACAGLRGLAGADAPLAMTFWLAMAGGGALAIVRPSASAWRWLDGAAGLTAGLVGLVHLVLSSPALLGPSMLDLALIALAVLIWGRRWSQTLA